MMEFNKFDNDNTNFLIEQVETGKWGQNEYGKSLMLINNRGNTNDYGKVKTVPTHEDIFNIFDCMIDCELKNFRVHKRLSAATKFTDQLKRMIKKFEEDLLKLNSEIKGQQTLI